MSLCLGVRFSRRGGGASLAEPLIDGVLVESPVLADLLARDAALLCQLVERRFRDFQILSQLVDGEHAAAGLGWHEKNLCSQGGPLFGETDKPHYRFVAVAVNFPYMEGVFPAAESTAVSRTLGRSVSAREP